jgi:hypothetical protein
LNEFNPVLTLDIIEANEVKGEPVGIKEATEILTQFEHYLVDIIRGMNFIGDCLQAFREIQLLREAVVRHLLALQYTTHRGSSLSQHLAYLIRINLRALQFENQVGFQHAGIPSTGTFKNFSHGRLHLTWLKVSYKNLDLFLQLLQLRNQQTWAQVLGCYCQILLAITECCFNN